MCGKKRIATKIPPAGGGGSRKQTFLSFVGAPSGQRNANIFSVSMQGTKASTKHNQPKNNLNFT